MLRKLASLWFIALLFVAVQSVFAQSQTSTQPSPDAIKAAELFQNQKWAEAVVALDALTKAEPQNGMAWYRLGASLNALNKHADAISPLQRAVEILQGPMAKYLLGVTYARLNDKDKAFASLSQAADAGFAQLNRVQTDPGLASLREDPRYEKLLESIRRAGRPCEFSEKARQLDFWLGVWDVQVNGQSVGTNVIERSEDGCIIQENWQGQSGITGKSINFYNPRLGVWRQTYVGSNMAIWEMSGEYKGGAMHYHGQVFSPNGVVLTRVTLSNLEPGRIRHTQEDSSDGGKTWSNVWDSIYLRKTKVQ